VDKIKVGEITAPVGIKGEIRVFPFVDRESRFSDIKKLYLGDKFEEHTIEKYRQDKNMIVLKLSDISDRNAAETLRGKTLYADKDEYILDEDAFFIEDLLGSKVYSEDKEELGVLSNIIQNTYQDIYEVKKSDGKVFLVPAVKEFIKDIDIDNKTIVIHVIEGLL